MDNKSKINYLKEKHTFVLCIFIAVAFLSVLYGTQLLIKLGMSSKGYGPLLIQEFVGVIFSVIIMILVGKKHILREKGTGILKGLFVGGFLVVIGILSIISGLAVVLNQGKINELLPLSQIVIFAITMAEIGMAEEFIFRGIILNLFLDKFHKTQKGIYASIAASSIIFGMAHMTNMFSGVTIKGALVQASGAVVLGALLAAIYIRTKNIWVVVIIHAFNDFSSLIGSGLFGTNSVVSQINTYGYIKLIGCLIYLIPVFVLLRKKKLLEIVENE